MLETGTIKVIANEEKLACVKRGLRMREYVYPRRVSMGSMTQETADREIAVMEAIVADYTRQVNCRTDIENYKHGWQQSAKWAQSCRDRVSRRSAKCAHPA